nr:hypothetical protein [Hyphomonas sp. 34-62-18]
MGTQETAGLGRLTEDNRKWRSGGCHCRAVRFEVELPDAFEVEDCNCTMCAMSGNIHVIVPPKPVPASSG